MIKYALWLFIGTLLGCSVALGSQRVFRVGETFQVNAGMDATILITRPDVRVTHHNVKPGHIQPTHAHNDVFFHLFIPLTEGLRLTTGSTVVDTHTRNAFYIAAGTQHGWTNTSQSTAEVTEVMVLRNPAQGAR